MNKNQIHRSLVALSIVLPLCTSQVALSAQTAKSKNKKHNSFSNNLLLKQIAQLEENTLHKRYDKEQISSRIIRLEKKVFGSVHEGPIQYRLKALIAYTSSQTYLKSIVKPTTLIKANPKEINQVDASQIMAKKTSDFISILNKRSWDSSSIIDELLQAEENADSKSLSSASDKLFAIAPHDLTINSEDLKQSILEHDLGVKAYKSGSKEEALVALNKALILNPLDANLVNDLVKLQIETDDLKSAILYCPLAIANDPSSSIAWCNMAEIFARDKQYARARSCAYFAYLMSHDIDKSLKTIQYWINNTKDANACAPFKEALFMVEYMQKNGINRKSTDDGIKAFGVEADLSLYKSHLLLKLAPDLQQIKANSGIVVVITIAHDGKVLNNELMCSSGNTELDSQVINIVARPQLPPLPQSFKADSYQFIIPVDKVVQELYKPEI